MEEWPPIWRVAKNIYLRSNHGQLTRGGPSAWGLDEALTTPHCNNWHSYETYTDASDLD